MKFSRIIEKSNIAKEKNSIELHKCVVVMNVFCLYSTLVDNRPTCEFYQAVVNEGCEFPWICLNRGGSVLSDVSDECSTSFTRPEVESTRIS